MSYSGYINICGFGKFNIRFSNMLIKIREDQKLIIKGLIFLPKIW